MGSSGQKTKGPFANICQAYKNQLCGGGLQGRGGGGGGHRRQGRGRLLCGAGKGATNYNNMGCRERRSPHKNNRGLPRTQLGKGPTENVGGWYIWVSQVVALPALAVPQQLQLAQVVLPRLVLEEAGDVGQLEVVLGEAVHLEEPPAVLEPAEEGVLLAVAADAGVGVVPGVLALAAHPGVALGEVGEVAGQLIAAGGAAGGGGALALVLHQEAVPPRDPRVVGPDPGDLVRLQVGRGGEGGGGGVGQDQGKEGQA